MDYSLAFEVIKPARTQSQQEEFDAFASDSLNRFASGDSSKTVQSEQFPREAHEKTRQHLQVTIDSKEDFSPVEKQALRDLEESILDVDMPQLQMSLRALNGTPFAAKVMKELGRDLQQLGVAIYAGIGDKGAVVTVIQEIATDYRTNLQIDGFAVYSQNIAFGNIVFGSMFANSGPLVDVARKMRSKFL